MQILVGPHRERVERVDSCDQNFDVYVDLGGEDKRASNERFHAIQVLRHDATAGMDTAKMRHFWQRARLIFYIVLAVIVPLMLVVVIGGRVKVPSRLRPTSPLAVDRCFTAA